MAHITLKLIWFRLGESLTKMAEASGNISEGWFSWEDHMLDVLLFWWIGMGVFMVFVCNAVLTFFGPLAPRMHWERSKEGTSGAAAIAGTHGHEHCQWLNSALSWFYLHYSKFPDIVQDWIAALNDQVQKLGGPVQIKFEKVNSGSLPPKFGDVTFDCGPEDKLHIHCQLEARDLAFSVFASQQTHDGVKLTNLTTSILKLRGHLNVRCFRKGHDMMCTVSFDGRPDVRVVGKPVNPYQEPDDLVDIGVVEEVVRNAICLASTTMNITKWVTGSSENLPRPEAVFEPIKAKEQHSAFQVPTFAAGAPPKPRRAPGEKILLVKVIKASGIGILKDGVTIDPCCLVYIDIPPQTQATGVQKNTVNPFWDEQFFFNISDNTQELRFEIIDRNKPVGVDFLGEAFVYYEDIKRNPSSRQIIPLQGHPNVAELVSGSITIELLFLDQSEADMLETSLSPSHYINSQISPKRMIETTRTVTPSGTVVTSTTTTTQKAQYGKTDHGVDDAFHRSHQSDLASHPVPTIESTPTEETHGGLPQASTNQTATGHADKDKKKGLSLAQQIKKRFSRSKKRSKSAERATSSFREGSNYLTPPEEQYGAGAKSKDDLELVRPRPETPNLKKSRSLGGSLRKLFRRSRRRSRSRGETSRESSFSRSSNRDASKGTSRESSITRQSGQQTPQGTLQQQQYQQQHQQQQQQPQYSPQHYQQHETAIS